MKNKSLACLFFNYFIMFLILFNMVIVMFDSYSNSQIDKLYLDIEYFIIIIFSLEYLLRLWTANLLYPEAGFFKSRLRFVFSFLALIDLLAILPLFLPLVFSINLVSLRSLRLIRLVTLLKLNRHTDALTVIATVLKNKSYQLVSSFIVVFIIIGIASIVMFNVESVAQPGVFKNVFSSFWWAVATITTVGYGDIYPITPVGKLLSSLISFLGIGLVAIPTGIISAGFNELTEKNDAKNYKFCPYCGKKLT
jgi:voltage-gated potassium channel